MPTGPYPTYIQLFWNLPPHQQIYYCTPWLLILQRLIVYWHCSFVPSPQPLTHYCAGSGNQDRNWASLANLLPCQQIYSLLTWVRFLLNLKYKSKPKSLLKYQLYFSQIGCHKKKWGRCKWHTQTKGQQEAGCMYVQWQWQQQEMCCCIINWSNSEDDRDGEVHCMVNKQGQQIYSPLPTWAPMGSSSMPPITPVGDWELLQHNTSNGISGTQSWEGNCMWGINGGSRKRSCRAATATAATIAASEVAGWGHMCTHSNSEQQKAVLAAAGASAARVVGCACR